MKKVMVILLVAALLCGIVGCAAQSPAEAMVTKAEYDHLQTEYDKLKQEYDKLSDSAGNEYAKEMVESAKKSILGENDETGKTGVALGEKVVIGDLSYNAPLWRFVDSENGRHYYPFGNNSDGLLYVSSSSIENQNLYKVAETWDSYISGLAPDSEILREGFELDNGVPVLHYRYMKKLKGYNFMLDQYTLATNNRLHSFIFGMPESISQEYQEVFNAVMGSVEIQELDDADMPQKPIENIVLTSGYYFAGTDFPAGTYNIIATDGNGNVSSDNAFDGGILAIMGTEEDDLYEKEYKNVRLPNGTELKVDGLTIELHFVR